MESNRSVRVLYHCPCPDGAYAMLAAYLRFKDEPNTEAKYIPHMTYKALEIKNNPIFTKESEVYLVDFIGPENFITELSPLVKKITVLDHHKTGLELVDKLKAENNMPENVEAHYTMEKSGATIAWDYFSAQKRLIEDDATLKQAEKFYSYIEDNDLWRKSLPFTNEFSSGLRERNLAFDCYKNPNLFTELQYYDVDALIEAGKKVLAEEQRVISLILDTSFTIKLGGKDNEFGECLAVSTSRADLRSQMGNELAIRSQKAGLRGIGAIVYSENDMEDKTKLKVSLRSLKDEDTTPISLAYGGGGHKNASSFSVSIDEFNSWKKKE